MGIPHAGEWTGLYGEKLPFTCLKYRSENENGKPVG
jgi:hypothetical protein